MPTFDTIEILRDMLEDPAARIAFSAAGDRPAVAVRLDGPAEDTPALMRALSRPAILIGIDKSGAAPGGWADAFDVLMTSADAPGRKWLQTDDPGAEAERLLTRIGNAPHAASVFAQVLRAGESLSFENALVLESLGYSTLLAGGEFRTRRAANPARESTKNSEPLVLTERVGGTLSIRLNRPERHNALNAAMRNALVEAFQLAMADRSIERVELSGEGPSFSSGGDLDEFGTADDQGHAHAIRVAASVAALVHRCRDRVTARLHGACLGAGIEIPAAAGRIESAPDALFGLPEIGMGLIPGAGGTVTVPRRIGRHRTCWLGLSGERLDARTALDWGLVDRIAL